MRCCLRIVSLASILFLAIGCGGSGTTAATKRPGPIIVLDGGNKRIVQMDDINGTNWSTFGSPGGGANQFNTPTGVAFDSKNRIYICDYFNDRIVRINDISGAGWTPFGTPGSGDDQFNNPYKIAIDSTDRIYVTDSSNDRVVRFDDMSGTNWISLGATGSGVKQFSSPIGISIAPNFQVYITDYANDRIVRFDDMTGAGWTTLGTLGSGVGPFTSAVDIALDNNGHMLVTDRSGKLIQTDLMSVTGWTEYVMNTPQSSGYSEGKVLVVDQNLDQLTRIDSIGGAHSAKFGTSGAGVDQFTDPDAVRSLR